MENTPIILSFIFSLYLAGTGLAAPPVKEIPVRIIVEDDAQLFGAEGIQKAKENLSAMKLPYRQEILIQTLKELSSENKTKWAKIGKEDTEGQKRFWEEWTKTKIQQSKAQGIYVLICRSPGHIQIKTDSATRKRGFDRVDEDKLIRSLKATFQKANQGTEEKEMDRKKIRDQGLIELSEYLRDRLRKTSK